MFLIYCFNFLNLMKSDLFLLLLFMISSTEFILRPLTLLEHAFFKTDVKFYIIFFYFAFYVFRGEIALNTNILKIIVVNENIIGPFIMCFLNKC